MDEQFWQVLITPPLLLDERLVMKSVCFWRLYVLHFTGLRCIDVVVMSAIADLIYSLKPEAFRIGTSGKQMLILT